MSLSDEAVHALIRHAGMNLRVAQGFDHPWVIPALCTLRVLMNKIHPFVKLQIVKRNDEVEMSHTL